MILPQNITILSKYSKNRKYHEEKWVNKEITIKLCLMVLNIYF